MAVNKSFVVKNGLEVNTNLILADANTQKVGIGSTAPRFELDVAGGIGATDFYLSGIGTFVDELNVGTDGSILTVLGVGGSVGVGTALPGYLLDIRSPSTTGQTALYVQGDVQITGDLQVDDITFDDASVNNLTVIEALDVASPGISTFGGYADFNSDVDISGTLNVGSATTIGGYFDINDNVDISGTLNVGSATTIGGYFDLNAPADFSSSIIISGITTLGGYVDINNSVDISADLNVVGIATLATVDINAGDIEVSNVDTANLNVTGIATIATISVVGAELTNLNVTGVTTLGTVQVSSGIVTATSGIVTYYGDGSQLDGVIGGIGINTEGGLVGFGITYLHLFGAGVSTTFYDQSVGIATIFLEGGGGGSVSISSVAPLLPENGDLWYSIDYGRTFVYYDEVALGIGSTAVWVDAAPFNIGVVDIDDLTVGSLTVTNNASITGIVTASGVNVSGIVTASGVNVSGIVTSSSLISQELNVSGNAIVGGNLTVNGTETIINTQTLDIKDKTVGIASTSLASNITANGSGIVIYGGTDGDKSFTYNDSKKGFEFNIPLSTDETRLVTGSEKVVRVSGNVVNLVYNSSTSSNIGYSTNPTGNVSLSVTGIPTSSDFDDHSITFAVFVNSTGTARTCTSVSLNGVSKTIRWAGGSLSNAISGVTTSNGHVIFSFIGINTVGSASTTANYEVFGTANGGFW